MNTVPDPLINSGMQLCDASRTASILTHLVDSDPPKESSSLSKLCALTPILSSDSCILDSFIRRAFL